MPEPPDGAGMDRVQTARAYYRTLDEGAYDELTTLLAPGFVHDRPDKTIEGRDEFVQFMREGRPLTGTTHEILGVYVEADSDSGRLSEDSEVVGRGRLLDSRGQQVFQFVDVFSFDDGAICGIKTYTDR